MEADSGPDLNVLLQQFDDAMLHNTGTTTKKLVMIIVIIMMKMITIN